MTDQPVTRPVTSLSLSPEYRAYQRARAAVLEMPRATSGDAGQVDPSTYWAEELGNIDYMIEASPLIIGKLRHHAFHITGIRPYDYRVKADARRALFEARLDALGALDVGTGAPGLRRQNALLVPESPALGGFGYDIGGRLFNVDTLKFYEVLIGMERGGVLAAMRASERPVVCEIGAGWAGFAYQFKTLIPRCRYVIVDFAELFLYSATYLGAQFPDATLAFCGTAQTPRVADAGDADFVFVPHAMAAQVSSLPLDLTVNMVSFQEMTDAQVRAYAGMAADAACPWLYSFNRERSPYNTEIVSVLQALSDRYRLTEVPVLDTDYTSAMKKPPKAGKMAERSEFNYRHAVGRLAGSAPAARRSGQSSAVSVSAPAMSASSPASSPTASPTESPTASPTASAPARAVRAGSVSGPRAVLGMTLYNNAGHLPEAIKSLLVHTHEDFVLLLLDDASVDDTESVARGYVARDARVRYVRHASRQAMVATWREVAELAVRECPSAEFFAWVSDHDRWHPRWLERLLAEIDLDPSTVLTYPITRRMGPDGTELDKGPRLFDTANCEGRAARWAHFCREGVGAGDMVYGLMRIDTLFKAGVFRRVLRPDRLLVAELTLHGRFRQVPEVLWFRRESTGTSIDRQRHSLVLAGDQPRWFGAPPWFQHAVALWRAYAVAEAPPVRLSRAEWVRMLALYQLRYGWRHFRKTAASHAIGRGIDNVVWTRKLAKHYWHHAVYRTLVGARAAWGRTRRLWRRAVYEGLVLTHRLGLRGGGKRETR